MNWFDKIVEKIWHWLEIQAERKRLKDLGIGWDVPATPNLGNLPAWDECKLASCWNNNAKERMMNILSPHMPKEVFEQRINWMQARGANFCHVILANRRDGEYGGWSIYGPEWSRKVNKQYCDVMLARIERLRRIGFAVGIWLFTDNSGPYTKAARGHFAEYCNDLKVLGFFEHASLVCTALEADEYYTAGDTKSLIAAIRVVYDGKVFTHETPYNLNFAPLGDGVMYQVRPGHSVDDIHVMTRRLTSGNDRPFIFHEMERDPCRELCQAALDSGADAVGGW